ncbi:uncharacterized protein LOC129218465 [Uloborus diversus]|uniref:uncharacterized protein LOC129218465 n=1 Tax=Uloborus diversus TaxID=327109 RepID=UPI00240970D0|nr:uncharacterized protein LOC129218465 [Uloborus diversus]
MHVLMYVSLYFFRENNNSKGTQTEGFWEIIDELNFLRKELEKCREHECNVKFAADNITNDEQMRSVTGFTKDRFVALYNFLNIEEDLVQNAKLSQSEQFFLFMVKLRTGITNEFLAILFKVSDTTVSRYFTHVVTVIYQKLSLLNIWPSRELIQSHMPEQIRAENRNCRVIVDCTEFKIQQPSNPAQQQVTFSNYKNCNTLKAMIGISPSGAITFVSDLYCGSISDKELFIRSGMLQKLEPEDMVMADKGFRIDKELQAKQCTLKTPTFLGDRIQFPVLERENNNMLSNNRVHVERAIGRIKFFKYFEGDLPYTALHNANEVFFIASNFVNFGGPLIE